MDTTASMPSMIFTASSEAISEPVAKKQRFEENETTNDPLNLQNENFLQQMLQNFFPQSLNLPLMVPEMQTTPNKTANRKNYCDICKKQLCNKYFLRTHMFKMHGIVIDAPLTPKSTNKRLIDPTGDFESQQATQKCSECGYRSRSVENLLMHSIRHDKMNSMGAEDAEEFMKIIASHVEQATAESIDSENPNDSETSGSVSPAETHVVSSVDPIPKEAEQLEQTVLVQCSDDQLPAEFVIKIPVFSMITEARKIEFELIPLTTTEI
ncbi:hypothetical protein L5515_015328 [Caenorhabditis briggsae]|uniref:C2H2-type domain-containing protein n=1 Tax=Caenorhabditis briggsae TaxID=6238 RepID=A0AAE9J8P1_CAEBR|nr:hypothetical protein L5515_015328 [Caenorhabditis briggsae]